jgi:hypothetical protein
MGGMLVEPRFGSMAAGVSSAVGVVVVERFE